MNTTCVMKAFMLLATLAMVLASVSEPSGRLASTDRVHPTKDVAPTAAVPAMKAAAGTTGDPAWQPDPVWQPNHTGAPATLHDAVTYEWHASDFTACPTACGQPGSVHNRTASCLGSDETTAVDEGSCTESKPAVTNTCGATAACVSYAWNTAAFAPPCPDECGTAAFANARVVTCMGSDGNAAADEMSCVDDKPETAETCAATEACVTYSWDAAAFPSCPDECGTPDSNQTRAVTCMGSDGNVAVDASRCMGTMPTETQACAGTEACVNYSWNAWLQEPFVDPSTIVGWQPGQVAAFPACDTKYSPSTCDSTSTSQTRTVACVGSDGSIAADETSCTGVKPAESNACPAAEACLLTRAYRGLGQAASGSLLVAVLLAL